MIPIRAPFPYAQNGYVTPCVPGCIGEIVETINATAINDTASNESFTLGNLVLAFSFANFVTPVLPNISYPGVASFGIPLNTLGLPGAGLFGMSQNDQFKLASLMNVTLAGCLRFKQIKITSTANLLTTPNAGITVFGWSLQNKGPTANLYDYSKYVNLQAYNAFTTYINPDSFEDDDYFGFTPDQGMNFVVPASSSLTVEFSLFQTPKPKFNKNFLRV